jgi:hypothetical protein
MLGMECHFFGYFAKSTLLVCQLHFAKLLCSHCHWAIFAMLSTSPCGLPNELQAQHEGRSLGQKFWQNRKKNSGLGQPRNFEISGQLEAPSGSP